MIKKLLYLIIPFLTLACSADNDGLLQEIMIDDNVEFYATVEVPYDSTEVPAKVYADPKLRVLWNADDRISIFNKRSANIEYRFKGNNGDNAGSFAKVGEDGFAYFTFPHIVAIYPYHENNYANYEERMSVIMSNVQEYKENSFGMGANLMVSVTNDEKLLFKNVGGYLLFKFYGEDVSIKSIILKGNNNEKISGFLNISMLENGEPSASTETASDETLTLNCASPVALAAGSDNAKEFWFVVPPIEFTDGFSITVVDDQGRIFEKSTKNSVIVCRNKISRMAAIEILPTDLKLPGLGFGQWGTGVDLTF